MGYFELDCHKGCSTAPMHVSSDGHLEREREWIGGLASASENNWEIQRGFVVQWLRHLPRQQETLGLNPGECPTFFTCQKAQKV